MTRIYENYVITEKCNLDLAIIEGSCYQMHNIVMQYFKDDGKDWPVNSPLTSHLFSSYNLFLYPLPGFYDLYTTLKHVFRTHCKDPNPHYVQCWLNWSNKNDFFDWHTHWTPETKIWHGFYCVNVEPSKTIYRIPGVAEPVDIISENNLLVISQQGGDYHRTLPWPYNDRPRITIGYDIVPAQFINPTGWLNHWVPI